MCAGIRQFHFNAWKDPNGTLASTPAGLKLAGITNVTLDPKYTYFGTASRSTLFKAMCLDPDSWVHKAEIRALPHSKSPHNSVHIKEDKQRC